MRKEIASIVITALLLSGCGREPGPARVPSILSQAPQNPCFRPTFKYECGDHVSHEFDPENCVFKLTSPAFCQIS